MAASRKDHELCFDKMIDRFALQLSENEKQRLVHYYKLSDKYYDSTKSNIQVMVALKMIGLFSLSNPEGLLDIAEFLNRTDLIDAYTPEIKELKNAKPRKSSVMLPWNVAYDGVDLGSALDIARKQIEIGQAHFELLQKICHHRKPRMEEQILENFEKISNGLGEVVTDLHQMKTLLMSGK